MQDFERINWKPMLVQEQHAVGTSRAYKTAHWVISDWIAPVKFEEWVAKTGIVCTETIPTENMYVYCSRRLTRPECVAQVSNAATRLELDPGHVRPFEKMASFYILKLLAGIHRTRIWDLWSKVPVTRGLLADETFCLCVLALHPVLFGHMHPKMRNRRCVFLQALALWDCKSFSIVQFVHPKALFSPFRGEAVHRSAFARNLKEHVERDYWLFNDPAVVFRAMGGPGARRWFELEFAGPAVVDWIVAERKKHGNSLEALKPYLRKNKYIGSHSHT